MSEFRTYAFQGALGALERTYKVELEETSVNNTFVVLLEDSSNQ